MNVHEARGLGFWTAVALVMGNMIGSGVFLLPASLAPYGGISLVGWVVSAGGSVLLALVFARLAAANPATGGPYAYTRAAFGDLPGFLVAFGDNQHCKPFLANQYAVAIDHYGTQRN